MKNESTIVQGKLLYSLYGKDALNIIYIRILSLLYDSNNQRIHHSLVHVCHRIHVLIHRIVNLGNGSSENSH